jgi:hypothetical protein
MEEGEIEQEVVSALDQEARPADQEDDKDALSGEYLQFGRMWTGRNTGIPDDEIYKLLKRHKHDLHGVPLVKRGDTYRYMLKRLGEKMRRKMKSKLQQYIEATNRLRLMKVTKSTLFDLARRLTSKSGLAMHISSARQGLSSLGVLRQVCRSTEASSLLLSQEFFSLKKPQKQRKVLSLRV